MTESSVNVNKMRTYYLCTYISWYVPSCCTPFLAYHVILSGWSSHLNESTFFLLSRNAKIKQLQVLT